MSSSDPRAPQPPAFDPAAVPSKTGTGPAYVHRNGDPY